VVSGRLRSGDKGSEGRAFLAHPALLAASNTQHPPALFHKTDLRIGGLDTIAHEGLATISDPRIKVVGVVLTSDHGHILERNSESRPGGGGERWRRTDTGPAGDGEILVSGPQVVDNEHAVVLPWIEQLSSSCGTGQARTATTAASHWPKPRCR